MNAEIGIDEEGKPYVALTAHSDHELSVLEFLRPWLPMAKQYQADRLAEYRIVGERLPGSGKGG